MKIVETGILARGKENTARAVLTFPSVTVLRTGRSWQLAARAPLKIRATKLLDFTDREMAV